MAFSHYWKVKVKQICAKVGHNILPACQTWKVFQTLDVYVYSVWDRPCMCVCLCVSGGGFHFNNTIQAAQSDFDAAQN